MCEHLGRFAGRRSKGVQPSGHGCQECLATGGEWVHLRLCLSCGHVGCCDSSPGHHATLHHEETGHPVIKSFEPGEDWAWCYVDEDMANQIQAFPAETPSEHYSA